MIRALIVVCVLPVSLVIADEHSPVIPSPPLPAKAARTQGSPLPSGTYSVEMTLVEFREGRPSQRLDEFTKVNKKFETNPSGATVLSSPRIRGLLGQTCNLQVERGGKIPFLQQIGPHRFEKQDHELEDALGIQMNVRIDREDGLRASIGYQSNSLAGTEGGSMLIAGVDVPIGKPMVAKNSRTWEFAPDLGDVYEVDLPTPKGRYARLRLRVLVGEGDVHETP